MGPLKGIKVIELKGIGPGPYAGMLLADMGAEVVSVERSRGPNGVSLPASIDVICRGKKSIVLNLKHPDGLATLLKLIESADMLIEGYRPGVAEKLGFGPDVCHTFNPALIYGRITGWGQTGPLANVAGHDINYISLTGALAAIGGQDQPVPPLNLIGDYAGGSLFLVMGMLAALHAAKQTGKGDVIDAAITDGSANLMSMIYSLQQARSWQPKRAANLLDGAAHFYRTYETADNEFVSIGSIEPQFYALLIEKAGLDKRRFAAQHDASRWPDMAIEMEDVFKQRTRDEWCDIMEGTDVCFAPVLDYNEAATHPHNQARGTYIDVGGVTQPAPAPRFAEHSCAKPSAPSSEGHDTQSVLRDCGFSESDVAELVRSGAIPS